MMGRKSTALPITFKTCRRRAVQAEDYPPPPGYEWIPDYLAQYGDQLTPWGRDWLDAKALEPWQAAIEAAEQEYQDCLDNLYHPEPPAAATGLAIRLQTRLTGLKPGATKGGNGLSARLDLSFSEPPEPPAPVAPRSVFYLSTTAAFDEDALYQSLYSPWGLYNPDRPLSHQGIALDGDAILAALGYTHDFAPFPPGVQIEDDIRDELEVVANRLDLAAQGSGGVLVGTGSAVHAPGVSFDFRDYYASGGFNWGNIAVNCFDDVTVRVQASPSVRLFVMNGGGDTIADLLVSLSHIGPMASWRIAARHRLFHNSDQVTELAPRPRIDAGPAAIGQRLDPEFGLPDCLAGQVEPDPAISAFDQSAAIAVLAVPGASPERIGLQLMRLRPFYHLEGRMTVVLDLIPGAHDVRRRPAYAAPILCALPIAWQQCNAADGTPWNPDRDSLVTLALESWTLVEGGPMYSPVWPYPLIPNWDHRISLRLMDYRPPCDTAEAESAFTYQVSMRVIWPDGRTRQCSPDLYPSCGAPGDSMSFVWEGALTDQRSPITVDFSVDYLATNVHRNAADTGYEDLPIPGSPARRSQRITPAP